MGVGNRKMGAYLFGGVGGRFAERGRRGEQAGVAGEGCAEHCGGCWWVDCVGLEMELVLKIVELMIGLLLMCWIGLQDN